MFRIPITIPTSHTGFTVIMHHPDIIIGLIPITADIIILTNPTMGTNIITGVQKITQGIITIEMINMAIVQVNTEIAAK